MLQSDDILRLEVEGDAETPGHVTVPANETRAVRAYVTARPQDAASSRDRTGLSIWVEDVSGDARAGRETTFNGRVQP